MNARTKKIVISVLVPLAVVGIGAGIFIGQRDGSTSNLAGQPGTVSGSAKPGTNASTGTDAGTDAPVSSGSTSASPAPTSAAPSSNSDSVIDAGAKDVISRFGQDRYDKAIQFADMFAGLAHGDCSRLSGQNDGTVALTALYTPDALKKVLKDKSAALIDVSKSGVKFADENCSIPTRTTWKVTVEGTKDPIVWVEGTVSTTLKPSDNKPFKITQWMRLGLVQMPGTQFGWQTQKSDTSKVKSEAIN